MSRFALITDSTSDLPTAIADERQIHIAPLYVIWGQDSLRDGVDITSEQFYRRLAIDPVLPTTSQPTPADFVDLFNQIRAGSDIEGILVMTISVDLSGTYTSAMQAREMVDYPVEVVDMRSISMGTALPVLQVADARDRGASLQEAAALARSLANRTPIYFTVDTLEYLHRGGRIGGARRLIGTAFSIKPVLEIANGRVEAKESIRTRKRALSRLTELYEETVDPSKTVYVGVLHGQAPDDANWLEAEILARYKPAQLIKTQLGAVIGVHTGPGTVGFALLQL